MSDDAETPRLHGEITRGDAAQRLLQEPLLTEAFEAVRKDLEQKMFATLPSQSAERDKLYLSHLMLGRVEGELVHHIETGKLAKQSLADRARGVVRRAAEPLRRRFAAQ